MKVLKRWFSYESLLISLGIVAALLMSTAIAQVDLNEVSVAQEYPEGIALGDTMVRQFAIEELVDFRALDSYNQPEWMDVLVENGTLPPVEERLPDVPYVYLEGGMSNGIGEYGGVWRGFSAVPTEGWNLCSNLTQGWFGINAIYGEQLVKSGPVFLRSDRVEPWPNLATGWEWSEDGLELTMNLIEGAKWSDGDPFDSEDVMFTWEDCILDENVTFWSDQTKFSINGEPVTLEAVDEYTVKWTFPEPFANYMLFNMDMLDFTVAPAHIGKQLHPRYNPDNDYISFTNSQPSDMLPAVTMGPWVPVEYQVDEFLVMRRNPYYWKVDEAGNQLPYIDEVTFEKGDSGLGRTLGTLAGSIDHTNLENPSSYVEATRRLQEEDAHFYIEWGPETLFFSLELNLSANLGVETERDEAMRGLFRDLRFRRALTHAIDREGVAQSIIRGPFLRPFPGGISPGSNFYNRESVAFYDYEPDISRSLLADLGFEDTDGDGVLNWTYGPLAGENLIILLNSGEDAAAGGQIAEALVLLMQDVGIQVNHRPITSTANADNDETGAWEARIGRSEQVWAVPNTRCNDLAPVTKQEPGWHREGNEPRELLAFEQDLIDLVNEFCTEPDSTRQTEILAEYNRIYTENVYTIGTVLGRYGLALAERFNNVPAGTPAFFYQWTWSNVNGDQVWVAPENQLPQVLPNTIPVYGNQAGN